MPYTPTVWSNETPASTPVKYVITDDTAGEVAASATIAPVTSITPGTPINAANLNNIEDGLEAATLLAEAAIPSCGAMVRTLGSQATNDSTETVLPFATKLYDPTTLCWSSGANNRLTVPVAGLYLVYVNAVWTDNATGIRRITVTYGAGAGTLVRLDHLPTTSQYMTVVGLRYFSAASYVQVRAYQTSGGALSVIQADFGLARIG